LFVSYAFPLTLFSSLFAYVSPPLLFFTFENRPAPFPGRMSYKAIKPGFSFFFVFFRVDICFFVVLGLVFPLTQPRDSLTETSPK